MCESEVQEFGGPWTILKIDILKKYLEAYTTALKFQPSRDNPFELIYIDAFAGAGKYRTKSKPKNITNTLFEYPEIEQEPTRSGSARVALELSHSFQSYHFIDVKKENIKHLFKLKEDFSHLAGRIYINHCKAEEKLADFCSNTDWRMKRAVLFLDPFKLDVSWKTIEIVAQTKAIDMWFLFPIYAVNRMLRRNGIINPSWKKKLNDVFGSNSWENEFYSKSKQGSLLEFTNPEYKKVTDFEGIKSYTINRLKMIFPGVSKTPRVLRNSSNSPIFVLFFAVGNERGSKLALRIANNILLKS